MLINFPFYIKSDDGMTFTKMLSPYELIELTLFEDHALIYRTKNEEFTGSYKKVLNDEAMYSSADEFNQKFTEAEKFIKPPGYAAKENAFHLN